MLDSSYIVHCGGFIMTEKSILDGFGNRLGLLKKAFSLRQDAKIFLKKFYKGHGRLDIYEQDVGLVDFYYQECRIDNGLKNDTFDDVKFEEEARKRIMGDRSKDVVYPLLLTEEERVRFFYSLMARIVAKHIDNDPASVMLQSGGDGIIITENEAEKFLLWFKREYPGIKLIEPFDDDIPF